MNNKPVDNIYFLCDRLYSNKNLKHLNKVPSIFETLFCSCCNFHSEHKFIERMYDNKEEHNNILEEIMSVLNNVEFYAFVRYFIQYLETMHSTNKKDKNIDSILMSLYYYRNYILFLINNYEGIKQTN